MIAATAPRGMHLVARHASIWATSGMEGHAKTLDEAIPDLTRQLSLLEAACDAVNRDPSTLAKLLMAGTRALGISDSKEAFIDSQGRLGDLGFTDLVIHAPRLSPPFAGDPAVLEDIAAARK